MSDNNIIRAIKETNHLRFQYTILFKIFLISQEYTRDNLNNGRNNKIFALGCVLKHGAFHLRSQRSQISFYPCCLQILNNKMIHASIVYVVEHTLSAINISKHL